MPDNLISARLDNYVSGLKPGIKRQYDRGVNRDLSQQQWQGLFKRNITTVLRQAYHDALAALPQLCLATTAQGVGLAEQTVKAFDGLVDELMQYALHKHRSSCALSNFPAEHNPSREYIAEVLEETGRQRQAFVQQVERLITTDG